MDWAEADEPRTGPQRRCIVTGLVLDKSDLLRFVVSPDQQVVPDLEQKLPGRGIWLSPRRDVVHTAMVKRLFARAARQAVTVPQDLPDRLEALLVRRCLDALALARRAGQTVCGFEKVRAEIKSGQVAVLIQARDAADGGREKMQALATACLKTLPLVELFDAAEMGAPFGRDQAVHAIMRPGGLARRFLGDARHLVGFRSGEVRPVSPAM